MIVVDASAFLELLLRTPTGLVVEELLGQEAAAAPHLFDAEVLHRLVTFGKQRALEQHEVDRAVANARDAPIARVDHRPLLMRARELSSALSGYDALYAALADVTGGRLVTGDLAFAKTARSQLGLEVADLIGG
ncbi:MAG: type II toxin-antitoxin system VapC family toxin [Acidimicrobiales bacterium]